MREGMMGCENGETPRAERFQICDMIPYPSLSFRLGPWDPFSDSTACSPSQSSAPS